MSVATELADVPGVARPARLRTLAGEQLLVTGAQLLAGAGNLVFALLLARRLAPGPFTDVAAFLAAYLLLCLPGASLAAGTALTPDAVHRLRRVAAVVGGACTVALVAGAGPLASALHQPVALPLLLAAAAPTAALLGLERGALYGTGRHVRVSGSLVVEPVVRLAAGLALAERFGAPGAAVAVVLGGWAALALALPASGRGNPAETAGFPRPERPVMVGPGAAVAAFLLLAVVQNQDVLLATHMLPAGEAARFAVLSTIGGVAAFATATIPLVLLPRAGRGHAGALRVALAAAVAIGAGAVAVLAVAGRVLVPAVFGDRYRDVAGLAAPYVGGMALLGVARVLVADRTAAPKARTTVVLVALAAALQAALVVRWGVTASGVVAATVTATASLTVAVGGATVLRLPATRTRARALAAAVRRPDALALVGVTAAGFGLRMLVTRSVWVDEAISIAQAKLPFADMIRHLEQGDVHPPLYGTLQWLSARAFGTGELAVRIPSILAGVALIPAVYVAADELFDRRAAIVAAALAAVSPLAIWYSQEARMYSLFMLFAVLAIWGQARAMRRGAWRDWLLYGLASALLVWTQYFGALQIVAQQLVFAAVALRRRRDGEPVKPMLIGWAASMAFVVVALLPLRPYFGAQLHAYADRGGTGLSTVPSQAGNSVAATRAGGLSIYAAVANLLWALVGYHSDATMAQLAALWPVGMLGALLLLGRRATVSTWLLVTSLVLPMAALFALGTYKRDLFELRYAAGAVPILVLLGARAITTLARGRVAGYVVGGLVAVLLLGALADQQLNGTNPRLYDFRGALHQVRVRARPGDRVVYNPSYLGDVLAYYTPELAARPVGSDVEVPAGHHVFLVGSFLDKPDVAARTGTALAKFRQDHRLVTVIRRPQIRVWEFANR